VPTAEKEQRKKKRPLSPAAKRAKRIRAEIEVIIEAGTFKAKYLVDPLIIRPLGAFAAAVSSAFAQLMEKAESPPVDFFVGAVHAEHPDWHPDKITTVAIQRFVKERGRLSVIAAAVVSSDEHLMYKLAGLAVRLPNDVEDSTKWAEDTLLPGEAMRIVRSALVIGEIPDFLGESLSILGTEEEPDDDEDETDKEEPTSGASSPGESSGQSSGSTTSAPESSTN